MMLINPARLVTTRPLQVPQSGGELSQSLGIRAIDRLLSLVHAESKFHEMIIIKYYS